MHAIPHYALCLSIVGKKCVVVGGGRVALRKVRQLLFHGAQVTVVSPQLHPELRKLLEERSVNYRNGDYRSEDLIHAHLVFAATSSREVNRQVWGDAEASGKLVNVVDDPSLCSFIVPAVFHKGPLQFAVSTSGIDPAGAKRIRDALAADIESVESAFARTVRDWDPRKRVR